MHQHVMGRGGRGGGGQLDMYQLNQSSNDDLVRRDDMKELKEDFKRRFNAKQETVDRLTDRMMGIAKKRNEMTLDQKSP